MSSTSAICQHSATYLDVDEVKCWSCNTSLTYPARPPGPEDAKDRRRDVRILAGEHRRRDSSPVEVEAEVSQLLCHCCQKMLPQNDFHVNNHQAAEESELPRPEVPGVHRLPAQGQAAAKPGRRKAERPGAPEAVLDRVDAGAAGAGEAAPRSGGERLVSSAEPSPQERKASSPPAGRTCAAPRQTGLPNF